EKRPMPAIEQMLPVLARHLTVWRRCLREGSVAIETGRPSRKKEWPDEAEVAVDRGKQPRLPGSDGGSVHRVKQPWVMTFEGNKAQISAGQKGTDGRRTHCVTSDLHASDLHARWAGKAAEDSRQRC